MYAALLLSAAATAGTVGIPFFHRNELISGIPIQTFGVIVAAGVLIGAAILRRYAEWHAVGDNHIRGLTGWITVTGFIGAHVFDVVAYQWEALQKDPLLLIKIWAGISSYGGFIGGAMGFAFYVWWKRLPARLMADIAIVGLLPAFSIGRIGCTVVSDHIGAAVDPTKWYAALAMAYPRDFNSEVVQNLVASDPGGTGPILAWNLGFLELLYLIPVNALVLWLAFRKQRLPAGFLVVLTGVLYAPVRFAMEYLRPESSDPRYFDMTFAQWASLVAFGASVYLAVRLIRSGKPAETIAPTSREAQQKLQVILKEDVRKDAKANKGDVVDKQPAKAPDKTSEPDPVAEARRQREEKEEAEAAERRRKQDEELAARKK
jgi:phosphatidylglycerol---prolipoprotein diacylglyceryl transferase